MRYVIVVVALVVLAFLVMDFNSRSADLNRLTAEHALVKAEYDSKLATKAALESKIAFATSEAAVYQWAYENHMVRPGDIPVVPIAASLATPTPAPASVETRVAASKLDRWLLLFIDPE